MAKSGIKFSMKFGGRPAEDQLTVTTAAGTQTLRVGSLSESISRMATLHGLKQKLGDAAAISRDPETGRSATASDKAAAVLAVLDRLLAGQWHKPREAGSDSSATGSIAYLLPALCEVYPTVPRDVLEEKLAQASAAEKSALVVNPRIAPVIDRLMQEAGAGGDGSDGLLASLEGWGEPEPDDDGDGEPDAGPDTAA